MPKLMYVEAGDEISDLVDAVKNAGDREVALVLPSRSRAFQTPLNARLLSQFAASNGRTVSIVSEEPRVQEMARAAGFSTFASVQAYERGIEVMRPQRTGTGAAAAAAGAGAAAAVSRSAGATAVAEPVTPTELSEAWTRPAPKPDPFAGRGIGRWDRRPLYFAGVAIAVIGILVFMFVAPTATVTVSVAATQINANPVIQGSTDPTAANQPDHLLTAVVTADNSASFPTHPTGTSQVPATASTGTLHFTTTMPSGVGFQLQPGPSATFTTPGSSNPVSFTVTQATFICIGPNGTAPPPSGCPDSSGTLHPALADAQVQSTTAGVKTNVGAGTLDWPNNPCTTPPDNTECGDMGYAIQATLPQPTSGGTDAKTIVVASAGDVANFQAQLNQTEATLQAQLTTTIQSKAQGVTIATDPTGSGKTLLCDPPSPPLPQPNQQYADTTISVACHAKATTYKSQDVKAILDHDLKTQLPQGDELIPNKVSYGTVSVTQASDDGTATISASATGAAIPTVNVPQLITKITGQSPSSAGHTIQGVIPGTRQVNIQIHPFGFLVPFFSSRITLDIVPIVSSSPPGK